MKLVIEVEIQTYNEDEEKQVLAELDETLQRVIALCQTSVGTFVTSRFESHETR